MAGGTARRWTHSPSGHEHRRRARTDWSHRALISRRRFTRGPGKRRDLRAAREHPGLDVQERCRCAGRVYSAAAGIDGLGGCAGADHAGRVRAAGADRIHLSSLSAGHGSALTRDLCHPMEIQAGRGARRERRRRTQTLACLAWIVLMLGVRAYAGTATGSLNDGPAELWLAVVLNGQPVSAAALVLRSPDRQLFVSRLDLTNWRLRIPRGPHL